MIEKEKIEELMKASAPVQPADNFTARVMATLSTSATPWYIVWQSCLRRPVSIHEIRRTLTWTGDTLKDCACSFFIAAFFYLIMSLAVYIGLKGEMISLQDNKWLVNQNLLFLFAGLWLGILGMFLYRNGERAVSAVRLGVVLYILFPAVDAILVKQALPWRMAASFAVVFTVTSIVIAYYLSDTIEKHERNSIGRGRQSCPPCQG